MNLAAMFGPCVRTNIPNRHDKLGLNEEIEADDSTATITKHSEEFPHLVLEPKSLSN